MCDPAEPCKHMEEMTSRYADGNLKGLAALFVRLHILYCKKCRNAVVVFRRMRARMHKLTAAEPQLDSARWAAIDAALDEVV